MSKSRVFAFLLTLALTMTASSAFAHPITVDGDPADWIARAPSSANLAIVARDRSQRGALVWLDATGDARSDLGDPAQVDITRFAMTADATNVYFRVDVAGSLAAVDPTSVPQVQIAIDTDRVPGSGQTFFAAFADTVVSEEARWERLVRTRAEGESVVRVLDTSFTQVGTGPVAAVTGASGTTFEMSVPWSALGLTGPAPLRVSVTTYRENAGTGLTNDIGGPTTSNALDVISNGGNPVPSAFPNAWDQDLNDGDVDHWIEVWFAANGEVIAPIAITRVLQSSTTLEWIEVRNQTSVPIDLSTYRLGDEETVDGTEGMAFFPPGTVLAPGAVFVVARQGTPFFTAYGRRADAEVVANDAMVPEMPRDTTWLTGTGTTDLAINEEVLLLGPRHTILDVITWGTSTYPGIVSLEAVPTDRVAYRNPDTLDTDDGAFDFDIVDDCATSAACGGGACVSCTRLACIPIPMGGACEDGNLCTTGETCNAGGACVGGTARTCDDANACTTNTCVPATGCTFTPTPAVPCDDASACTSGDACTAAGACIGTTVSCDDGNPCTADACDAVTGCSNTPTPGVSCADADRCDGEEVCSAAGVCASGTPPVCNDGNACTADSCESAVGCVNAPTVGASCNDGSACTTGDACSAAGTCMGTSVSCDDSNPCTADACDATTGCSNTPTPGVSCGDADACNGAEVCDAMGACAAGTPSTCEDESPCRIGACDPAVGCVLEVDEGAACDDADPCTTDDVCQADATCAGTVDPACDVDGGVQDGGTTMRDAGAPRDAAVPPRDGGVDGGDGPMPAGGCGCRAGGPDRSSAALVVLGVLALVVVRRRRR
jgi:MYXO-CTERM domain-containing protein